MTLADGAGSLAGPLGLLVVLLMGVAVALLIRGMNKHIRRLPESFEPQAKEPDDRDDVAG